MAKPSDYQSHLIFESVTIQSGQNLSSSIDLHGTALTAIIIPAVFDGRTLKFKASIDNQTYLNMFDDGGLPISITVGESRYIPITVLTDFTGARFMKFDSVSVQAAQRILTLVLRGMVRR